MRDRFFLTTEIMITYLCNSIVSRFIVISVIPEWIKFTEIFIDCIGLLYNFHIREIMIRDNNTFIYIYIVILKYIQLKAR